MDKSDVLNLARSFAALVKESLPISRTWLYGSWAYGSPNDESDIDIAFELGSEPENILTAEKTLYRLRRSVDSRIEPVVISPDRDRSGFSQMVVAKGTEISFGPGADTRQRAD